MSEEPIFVFLNTLCYCDENCHQIQLDGVFRSTDQQQAKNDEK